MEDNINILVNKVPTIQKIILFGSYSRKEVHYGSDVDLLIIVKKRISNDFEVIYGALFDISLDYEWSPLLITEKDFRERIKEGFPFIKAIINDGIIMWSKS